MAGCEGGAQPSPPALVSVDAGGSGRQVPASFLGFGFEYDDVLNYTGPGNEPDPDFVRLLRELRGGDPGPLSLRIGGNSTDDSLWDPDAKPAPAGVGFTFGRSWLDQVSAVAKALDASLILGVNLRVHDPSAASAWAVAAQAAFQLPLTFEIGNEPNYYGAPRAMRPTGYSLHNYEHEYRAYVEAIRARLGSSVQAAGPAVLTSGWMSDLPDFVHQEAGLVGTVTYHQYPLSVCGKEPGDAAYPAIRELLDDKASHGLATEAGKFAAEAHAAGLTFRVDEMNSVVCLGADGVSNTFASALWLVDLLFEYVAAGVDGVNLQTISHAYYTPFHRSAGKWLLEPEYRALQLIAEAFAANSVLLPVMVKADANLKAWATLDNQRTVRVVVLNKGGRRGSVQVAIRGRQAPAELTWLLGNSLSSRTAALAPAGGASLKANRGIYTINFDGAGGALLTVPVR